MLTVVRPEVKEQIAPLYEYQLIAYNRLAEREPPFEMSFASQFPTMTAGAYGEFRQRYPKLGIIRGAVDAGVLIPGSNANNDEF